MVTISLQCFKVPFLVCIIVMIRRTLLRIFADAVYSSTMLISVYCYVFG